MVDDDEVGEMDDSSDDLYDHNIEYDANETFSEGSDDSDIEEIFPSINGGFKANGKGQKDRYQSVSEDEDEDELGQSSKSMEEGEEEETRYNIKQAKAKTGPMEMASAESDPDPDSDEEGEEGEISAIFEPTIKKKSDGLTKRERKEKSAAKKAFWDAKGVAEEEDDSEAEQGVDVNMAE